LYDSYQVSRGNERRFPPIAKNHDFKPYASLVVIVFIGL
jgi:hypothetical protein